MIKEVKFRSLIRLPVDLFFQRILPVLFFYYEKHLFYRLRQSFGKGILLGIKNKGTNIKIHGYCTVIGKEKLVIKDNVRIGANCYFFALGGIYIGNNTQLSRNIVIYSANHTYDGIAIPYDDTYILKKVIIEDSVWIGMNCQILPGVTIGKGAIIGMGSVVTKNIPPYAIAAGNPAKIIKMRDQSNFDRLDEENKHFGKLYPNS